MPNELPIPEELKHLLEKRSGDERRQGERRTASEQSEPEKSRSGDDRRDDYRRADDDLYRPSEVPRETGRYRCENCLTVVRFNGESGGLPTCPQCGNRGRQWYKRLKD